MNKHIDEVINVTFVEESSGWNYRGKNIGKKSINMIWVPSQRYQNSRHILKNPKIPRNVMGFSNCAQRYTGPNYLEVDRPLEILSPIGDKKYPVGDYTPTWELEISESNQIKYIRWLICNTKLGIYNTQLGNIYPIGYFLLLVLYFFWTNYAI